ncbi:NUDIX hydrolase [Gigaspora margarita]|uniref:NUDIX hydrolase n=1 Tax=Gigaspora margarita TaxID=4874 RepID=A0A8H4A5I8_GIGMA|nr:NUDIX hydrolase [Gigaspora margarita]
MVLRLVFKQELNQSINIEPTVEELIDFENWQITNYISDKAYVQFFSNFEKRHEFLLNILDFYQNYRKNYECIKREILPRNRQDDLFKDAQDWRKNSLNSPKHSARFQVLSVFPKPSQSSTISLGSLEPKIDNRENDLEINQSNQESNYQKNQSQDQNKSQESIDQESTNNQFIDLTYINNYKVVKNNIKYEFYIQILNKIKSYGFTVEQLVNQVSPHIEVNKNLQNQLKQNLETFKKVLREFTICILVNGNKKIYLSRQNNSTKDYYTKYQVPNGGKKNNESYKQCARQETFEETQVKVHELEFIGLYEGFRLFFDEKKYMFKCAIYFILIGNQIPKQTKKFNNNKWFAIELKDFGKYNLTDFLREFKQVIIKRINSKFYSIKLKEVHKKKKKSRTDR